MSDVANWVARLNGEDGPGETPSHKALFSFTSRSTGDILNHWTASFLGQMPPRLVAEPCKSDERSRPSSQRPQYPTLYRRLKRRLGRSFRSSCTKGLWSNQEKRLHVNVLEFKAVVSLALQNFKDQCQNQTVLVATDNSTGVSYINKQGGTHSVEMCASCGRS